MQLVLRTFFFKFYYKKESYSIGSITFKDFISSNSNVVNGQNVGFGGVSKMFKESTKRKQLTKRAKQSCDKWYFHDSNRFSIKTFFFQKKNSFRRIKIAMACHQRLQSAYWFLFNPILLQHKMFHAMKRKKKHYVYIIVTHHRRWKNSTPRWNSRATTKCCSSDKEREREIEAEKNQPTTTKTRKKKKYKVKL